MAHEKNHDYHILTPSIWPLFGALSALTLLVGAVFASHHLGRGEDCCCDWSALRRDHVYHVRSYVLRCMVLVVLQKCIVPNGPTIPSS